MSIEVNNESDYAADEAEFSALARYVLDELHVHPQAELAIVFVDTQTMTDLNGRWMEEDGPTDVLSFPMDELRPGRPGDPSPAGLLGDVVLCPEVAAQQDRKSTRLNSSHVAISYAVFCLKKKRTKV